MTHGDQAKATWLLLFPYVSGCSHRFAVGWGGFGDGHQLCAELGQLLVVGEEKMQNAVLLLLRHVGISEGPLMGWDPLKKLPSPLLQGINAFLRARANIRGRGKTNRSPPGSTEATAVMSEPFQWLTKPAAKYVFLISTFNLLSGCFLPLDPSALCCQISPPRRGREPFPTQAPGASFQTFSSLCPELWPILQLPQLCL